MKKTMFDSCVCVCVCEREREREREREYTLMLDGITKHGIIILSPSVDFPLYIPEENRRISLK